MLGSGYEDFLDVAMVAEVRSAALAAAERSREGAYRRQTNWHNSRLAVFLELEQVDDTSSPSTWEIPVEYVMNLVKSRRHQAAFRRKLWHSAKPAACRICGIEIEEILEAAHIIPDSEGGPSSNENGLLLCANHHRAMDKNLFAWNGRGPDWAHEDGVRARLGNAEGRFVPPMQ